MKGIKHIYAIGIFLILLCLSSYTRANEGYKVELIPDSLKEGAVAIVRKSSAVFTQHDTNNGTYKVHRVITILNERGNHFANFYDYKDNFIDFKKFEGIVRSGSGKEIKKIKKKDLIESSLSSEMASDNKMLIYEVTSPVYPYTVEYTFEQEFKNGIIVYPSFYPIHSYQIAVEQADYTIELPLGQDLRYLSNFDCKIEDSNTATNHVYKFSSSPLKAIKEEPFMSPEGDVFPRVRVGVKDFCFDKVCGNLSTWKDFGIWQNKLLQGRDALSPTFIDKIKVLVKEASSNREKVEILYKFLQDNTRYVSIQLGIGGWQPISAESTINNNYGDCKGLSNLMKAMLTAIGIPSNYATIYMGDKKSLLKDFPDMAQTNHVVLLVPLENDSIWLECTSKFLPAGYIHDDIAGHDAIVMTDDGGVVCTLPSYSSEQNLTETIITMDIAENGDISGHMKFVEHLHGFGNYQGVMKSNDREKHVGYINSYVSFPRLTIGKINTSESPSENPSCTLDADFTATNYVTKTGQRLFIPLIPSKKSYFDVFKAKERVHDIVIGYGYSERDSITINLPENYKIESIPRNELVVSPYGNLFTVVKKQSESQIICSTYIEIKEGRYSKDEYNNIKDFFNKIVATNRMKMVARKSEVAEVANKE